MSTPEPKVTWPIALNFLNDQEMKRMACVYIYTGKDGIVDWDGAARDFGSASKASFQKMVTNATKKLKEAAVKLANAEITLPDPASNNGTGKVNGNAEPPMKKNGGGRKRAADTEEAGTEGSGEFAAAKKAKGSGKKVKTEEMPDKTEETGLV